MLQAAALSQRKKDMPWSLAAHTGIQGSGRIDRNLLPDIHHLYPDGDFVSPDFRNRICSND